MHIESFCNSLDNVCLNFFFNILPGEEETTVSVRTYDDDGAAGYYVIVESGVVLKNLNINNETELPQVDSK